MTLAGTVVSFTMPDITTPMIWITLAFFVAGMVKGVIGMGLPTVAMGMLTLVMAPAAAAATLVAPSLVTNVWQFFAGPNTLAITRRLALMMVTVCVGTFIGIGVLTTHVDAATATLGAVLVTYGAISLISPQFNVPARAEPAAAAVAGMLTGVLSGATGVFVVPAVPYLSALGLTREELMQALGLSFSVSTVALGVALAWRGQYSLALAGSAIAAILPALAGMWLGQRMRRRFSARGFRRGFLVAMMALGGYMVARAL